MHRCQVANNSISTVAFVNRNYIAMKLVSVCVWGGRTGNTTQKNISVLNCLYSSTSEVFLVRQNGSGKGLAV